MLIQTLGKNILPRKGKKLEKKKKKRYLCLLSKYYIIFAYE